jgi:hypothetical protein
MTSTARPSRSTRNRNAARQAAPAAGSQIVATLERVWAKVRTFAPELPQVVIITGRGNMGRGLIKLGHFSPDVWDGAVAAGQSPEIFVSGETLGLGAVSALTTLLHEATHVLAHVRGVQDTSRGLRYHNRLFVETARTFGLDYPWPAPHPSFGFSAVTLDELGLTYWAGELATLEAEIKATVGLGGFTIAKPTDPTDPRVTVTPVDGTPTPPPPPTGYVCGCGRIMRMARGTFAQGPILCGVCGEPFTPRG